MIRPDTAALFQIFDRAATGHTLKAQTEAAALVIYQAIVTASRISSIPRTEVLQSTMAMVGDFIAVCEILERKGESGQQEAATDAANGLIHKYTQPPVTPEPVCASSRGLECDCPGVICLLGSR